MNTRNTTRAVIFDYAGVLSLHQPNDAVRRMETICGVTGKCFQQVYWSLREPYDRGEVDGPAYWRAFARVAGCGLSTEQVQMLVEADTASWIHLNSVMLNWLRRLQDSGMATALLSNMGKELRQHVGQHFDWCAGFVHRTFSCDVAQVKPEPEIYIHCLDGLKMAPSEVLFIDDRAVNIAAAEALGMRGVLFTAAEELSERLPDLFPRENAPLTR